MSFSKLKAEDLLFVAQDDLGLEVPVGANRAQILALIAEKQVKWKDAIDLSPTVAAIHEAMEQERAEKAREAANTAAVVTTSTVKPQAAVVVEEVSVVSVPEEDAMIIVTQENKPAKTLVKMMRENPTFNIRGYKFTYDHPFVLVTQEDAEYLTTNIDGFYYATPKEAQEFYG